MQSCQKSVKENCKDGNTLFAFFRKNKIKKCLKEAVGNSYLVLKKKLI